MMIRVIILAALCVSISHCTVDYIRSNTTDQCPVSKCFTFDEWIHVSSQNLSRITELIFLRGIHFVSESQFDDNGLTINEIDSFSLTGEYDQDGKMATIVCSQNYIFTFTYVLQIHIQNITMTGCVSVIIYTAQDYYSDTEHTTYLLMSFHFINSGNISLENVNVNPGGLFFQDITVPPFEYMINSTIVLSNVHVVQEGIGVFLVVESGLSFLRHVNISSSTFVKSCIYFEASDSYIITMHEVTMIESTCAGNQTKPAIYLFNINKVIIGDLTIQNSRYPLLSASGVYTDMKQQGIWKFHHNVGGGVTIQANFVVQPGSITEFINNTVKSSDNLFELSASISPAAYEVRVNIKESTIKFKSNVAENNGLFVVKLLHLFTMSHLSYMLFENNECGTKLDSKSSYDFSEAAVMMMFNVDAFFGGNLTFINNSAPLSGGITAVASKLTFGPGNVKIIFNGNIGGDGGGMAMYKKAQIVVETYYYRQQDHFVFSRNMATNRGGGMYVEDHDYFNPFSNKRYEKFITTSFILHSVRLTFTENRAINGGNDLYGGWIDLEEEEDEDSRIETIKLDLPMNNTHSVASEPTRICICINSTSMCNVTKHYVHNIFPGKKVTIHVIAVGQRQGHVPAFVVANVLGDTYGEISESQYVQNVYKECTSIQYTIFSSNKREQLVLKPENRVKLPLDEKRLQRHPNIYILFQQMEIVFELSDCPPGFTLDPKNKRCICEKLLLAHGLRCNLDTLIIFRKEQTWVNVTYENLEPNRSYGTIIHEYCPHDYCRRDYKSLSLNLEHPNVQCNFNRSGFLCGRCSTGFSHMLGSSQCKKCSHFWLFALIPGVLISGILIIVLLMVLNLTVSSGTLNGLIFYANVIRASNTTYFQSNSGCFLSKFIAWLNLDLGIETCLYNGLDAYIKTWLQFFFPAYVWILLIVIIVASHYSTRASKLTGNNAVQVLATMFLLSYTKLVRVIITVFTSTVIEYPNGIQIRVWLYDGNVKYFQGKHTLLFITSLFILTTIILPYTAILGTIQWLQKISHFKLLSIINKLKPFLDAYTGPYKDKHRYWVGLLLLVRVIFLLVFTINQSNNPGYNLLSILVVTFALITYLSSTGGVYKNWLLNIIECLSLMNLGLLSATLLFQQSEYYYAVVKKNTFTYVSTSIALTQFVITTLYHTFQRLITTKLGRKVKAIGTTILTKRRHGNHIKKPAEQLITMTNTSTELTHTSVEMHQPLL